MGEGGQGLFTEGGGSWSAIIKAHKRKVEKDPMQISPERRNWFTNGQRVSAYHNTRDKIWACRDVPDWWREGPTVTQTCESGVKPDTKQLLPLLFIQLQSLS